MEKTLQYEGYRQDQFDQEEFPLHASGRGGVARLSPFDVPEHVDVHITPYGEALFCFRYSDQSEPPQKPARVWPGRVGISVVLGVHSWRILTLQVSAAETILANGPPRLDAREAIAWLKDAPEGVRIPAHRNAEVIAKIIASLPSQLCVSVVTAAREARLASNKSISRW